MRYAKGHREKTKGRMLEAAGRGFRTGGYGGVGVDALAKEAGVTSGAFYSHFGSKAQAFREALVDGLAFLRRAIEAFQKEHGPNWHVRFVDFYFHDRLKVDLANACALPTLTCDATRSDEATRAAYETELSAIADTIADGLPGDDPVAKRAKAWALMALFAGGAGMARAVKDEKLAEEIAEAARAEAKRVAGSAPT